MRSKILSLIALTGLLFYMTGCGEEKKPAAGGGGGGGAAPAAGGGSGGGAPPPATGPVFKVDPATAATLTGTISFKGEAPKRNPIAMGNTDPKCEAMHDEPVLDDKVIVTDGKLQNVFIYVKTGLEGKRFEVPEKPAMIDQKGCMYAPHVLGMVAGQSLTIQSSDATTHNIHAFPKAGGGNKGFNFGQTEAGAQTTLTTTSSDKTFSAPEVMVKINCDVHGWMHAFIGVLPHPYFAVSDEKGTFTIASLPPGKYTIEAWHEALGTQTQEIEVKDKESKAVDFTFEKK